MRRLLPRWPFLLALTVVFFCAFLAYRYQLFPHSPRDQSAAAKKEPAQEELREPQSRALEQLQALGYVDATFDPQSERRGVILFDRERASSGFNFYNSRTAKEALLVDMEGDTVFSWAHPTDGTWQHSELLPNGELLVIVKDQQLIKLSVRGSLLWTYEARVHHDLSVHEDNIYVLTRALAVRQEIHPERKILTDFITVLDSGGVLQAELSILDILQRSPYSFLLPDLYFRPHHSGEYIDVLHVNHIEVFDGSLASRSRLFEKGNMLLSARSIHAVFIVDQQGEVLWLWGPSKLVYQHHPRLLPNGNILIFNNGLEKSEVIELDPLAGQVVWRYRAEDFYSRMRGSNQRLSGGNTLITESESGYVFEVTPAGEIVWHFANPDVNEQGERSAIWRMTRFRPEELPFLSNLVR